MNGDISIFYHPGGGSYYGISSGAAGKMGVMTDNNGLYYMRARYYNTDIKRFINCDILSGNIADGKSLNNYAYCEGNPVSLADPFGLSPNINWSGLIHFALDMASMIPGVGIAFNVINMELYWMEGDTDALKLHALLGASFIGNVVGKAEFDKSFSSLKYGLAHGQLDFKNLVKSVGYGYMTVHGGIATVTSAAELGVAVGQAAVAGKQAISLVATKAARKANSALKKAESGIKDIHNNNGGFVNLNAGESGSGTEIPWSSKVVSDASNQLDSGAKSVYVDNRSQAEELFLGKYQGEGYTNVTGMDAIDAKSLLGGKGNTYHWDDVFGSDGYLVGHGAGNPDALMPHLQIHPKKGNVIRIFFGNTGGN